MSTHEVTIPEFGEARDVEVSELLVAVGDVVAAGDSLIVLESEKASVEVPSPVGGKVVAIAVKPGEQVAEGQVFVRIEGAGQGAGQGDAAVATSPAARPALPASATPPASGPEPQKAAPMPAAAVAAKPAASPAGGMRTVEVRVPDIGEAKNVVIAELLVSAGAEVGAGDPLVVLESDKASMEIESPHAGVVAELPVAAGSEVGEGTLVVVLRVTGAADAAPAGTVAEKAPARAAAPVATPTASAGATVARATPAPAAAPVEPPAAEGSVYAGPAVRRLARELGVELARVPPSGARGRIVKDDVQRYVKARLAEASAKPPAAAAPAGAGIPPIPLPDFARFGPIEEEKLPRVMRVGAQNLHRSWLNLPHVTHHDEVDVTELEAFRAALRDEARERGVRLTPLAFIVRACCAALKEFPRFNASLAADGATLIRKNYFHIGIAVDTPNGLLVPVIRDAERKGIYELGNLIVDLSARAREMKLKPDEMQGGTFSITSLGVLGGIGFTPIINAPEVAILGVAKLATKPSWNGSAFVPRQMLPLSLSYDHRVINGADAARFTTRLMQLLQDVRRLLL